MTPASTSQPSSGKSHHRGFIATLRDHFRRRANKKRKAANLDPTVLRTIFTYLDALDEQERGSFHSNVLSALLVCRAWASSARPVLYGRVWATSLKKSESLLNTLSNDRNLTRSVRYLEVGPIWKGTDITGHPRFSFRVPDTSSSSETKWMNAALGSNAFKSYLENMAACASLCTELLDIRLSADRLTVQEPHRAPRVDHFLDLSHTHIYLRRLLLDDGGFHATEVSEIFPLTVKLPHLEELTLKNFAFVSPPREQLFRGLGWLEQTDLADPLPRLRSLKLIYCTSEDAALTPLIRTVAGTLRSVTVVQMPHTFRVSPIGDTSRWHFSHSETEIFSRIGSKVTQMNLETNFYRTSNCLAKSRLTYLRITAEQFQKGALVDLPSTLRYLEFRMIGTEEFKWNGGQVDIFDLLEELLRGGFYLPQLKYSSLRFLPRARKEEEAILWVKIWIIKRLCRTRRRKVEMSVFLTAQARTWGEPLPPNGRRVGRMELPTTAHAARNRALRPVASHPKLATL